MTSGPMGDDEGLLTEEEAAALLRLSLPAVRQLRLAGSGPPHVGIGRQTRTARPLCKAGLPERASVAPRQTTASSPGLALMPTVQGLASRGFRRLGRCPGG
jgi:hypothetical protein